MADPITMLTIASAASIASSVIGGISSIQAGKAQQVQHEYQAKLAEREAQQTRAFSEQEAAKKRREGRLMESRQRAIAAASGGAGDPSVLNILATTEAEAQYAADIERFRGTSQAAGLQLRAESQRLRGRQARRQGILDGVGSFLGAGSTAFDRFGKIGSAKSGDGGGDYTYG